MKKLLVILAIAFFGVLARAQPEPLSYYVNEVRVAPVYLPAGGGGFDGYNDAYGIEVQYRNWYYDPIGFAAAIALQKWPINKDTERLRGSDMSDFEGSVNMTPLGGSVLYKVVDYRNWNLTAEAGVRYVIASSGADFLRSLPDGQQRREDLDVGDAWIWLLALDYEYVLNEQWGLFAGAGYQRDIEKGDITDEVGRLEDSELVRGFIRAGVKLNF
jgi:hypothetical protein